MTYRRPDAQRLILMSRPRIFIRHTDARLLMVSYAMNRTLITQLDGRDGSTLLATFDGNLAFDGGWNLVQLLHILDGCIGRVCAVCGRAISHNGLYCSNGHKQSAYRARNGK